MLESYPVCLELLACSWHHINVLVMLLTAKSLVFKLADSVADPQQVQLPRDVFQDAIHIKKPDNLPIEYSQRSFTQNMTDLAGFDPSGGHLV